MTATMHTAPVDTDEARLLASTSVMLRDLNAFLRDPIGFGDYDFADPITLAEFDTMRHMHHGRAHVLS